MKIRHTIMAGCLLLTGLASCEMKDEILGGKGGSNETGLLNLSVVVDAKSNDVVTKAEAKPGTPGTIPAVSATGYAVEISNSEGVCKTFAYDPTRAVVELPVGDYTIYAHAQGEPKKTEAYYGGRASLKVENGKSTDTAVTCKMMNTKIQLIYDSGMRDFQNWEITVTDGMGNIEILAYDGTGFAQPAPFYWMLPEGVKEIKVSITGTNKDGKPLRDSRVISKPAAAENSDWLGGDALAVTLRPGAYDPTNPSGAQGIEISAKVEWSDDFQDSVDVVVKEDETTVPTDPEGPTEPTDPTDPVPPAEGTPTITGDCIGKELTYVAGEQAPTVAVSMNVPGKIKDVKVRIASTNTMFEEALVEMGLTAEGGSSLITNETLQVMNLFPLPKAGETAYDFSLSDTLLSMLANFSGTHTFQLSVEDEAGKSANASFKLTIQKAVQP